jgi:transposase-like protein
MQCPQCASEQIVKNGSIHNGKQKYKCKACSRQFVENPQWRAITDETKAQIQKLLRERISLAGIVRVTGVSARWLQSYVNELYDQQPRQATVRSKKNGA